MKNLFAVFYVLFAVLLFAGRTVAQDTINEAVREISTIGILDTNRTKSGYRINDYNIELSDSLLNVYKGKRVEVTGRLLIVNAIRMDTGEIVQGALSDRLFIVDPVITILAKPVEKPKIDTTSELLIFRSRLFEIFVEKSIYLDPKEKNFLMKFTINNIYDSVIGVKLDDYWSVVCPALWGIYKEPFREVTIDELITNDIDLDKGEFFRKYRENALTMIKPGEKIEYFREWDGKGEKIDAKKKGEYMIVSFDGMLLVTNGIELDSFTFYSIEQKKRLVVIPTPVKFKTLPDKALIIKRK